MALSGTPRVLVLVDQPLIADVIELTLNHGVYVTREAQDVPEATAMLGDRHPLLAVIDMEIATVPGGYRFIPTFSEPARAS
jgi:CheY-like chemotaxis protein